MTSAAIGALLRPDSFVSGGLLDDVDVTIESCRFKVYDYDGKVPGGVLALHVEMKDEDGQVTDQYYSAGDLRFFTPSTDGKMAVPTGSKTALSSSSNAAQFIVSVVNAGYPVDQLEADVSVFEGMKVHVNRVAQPKRTGIIKNQPADDSGREKTVLLVSKILAMPGEEPVKKGGASKASAKPSASSKTTTKASAPAPAQADDADLDSTLTDIVMTIVTEAGGTITKKALSTAVFQSMKDHPARNAAVKRVYVDEFLQSGPWSYDGSEISLG